MTTQAAKSSNVILWVAAIAVILFCTAGIAAIMGWIPTTMGHSSDSTEPVKPQISTAPAKPAPAKARVAAAPVASTAPAPTKAQEPPAPVASKAPTQAATCVDCGVVESIRKVEKKGEGTGLGAVGGAVVGGLLGNQVGSGRGRDVATVVGAVGGVVAGNEVEKRVKSTEVYEVTIRLDDGTRRVITEANPPAFRSGDHVKIVDGAIRANS